MHFSMMHSTFRTTNEMSVSMVADNQRLEYELAELTSLVRQLAIGQQQTVRAATQPKPCEICLAPNHPTDTCPTLQEIDQTADVSGQLFRPQQQQYNPFSNTYNPGWRGHPNLRQQQQFQQPMTVPVQLEQTNYGPSLEELVKQMATNNIQFQQNVNASIQDLQTQIGQLAATVNHMQQQGSVNIPAQTIVNPKGNVSAISLRNGEELQTPIPKPADVATMKHHVEEHSDFFVDSIDTAVDTFTDSLIDLTDFAEFSDFNLDSFNCSCDESVACSICAEIALAIQSDVDASIKPDSIIPPPPPSKPPLPSTIQPPPLELKPVPEHIKYASLDDARKLLVIIFGNFLSAHEKKLLHRLKVLVEADHVEVFFWERPILCYDVH